MLRMKKLADQFARYVSETTGQPVDCKAVPEALPQYLAQAFELVAVKVAGRRFLGIFLEDARDFRPAAFEKQLPRLAAAGGSENPDGYCLVAASLPAYVRARLVERQIPFVVPGRQIHWPQLGLAYRERGANNTAAPAGRTGPVTQSILLLALNDILEPPVTPKLLAATLGVSAMSTTRALDEIEANGLGRIVRRGRERLLDFPQGRALLWKAAAPLMRNPVRTRIRVAEETLPADFRLQAGETALASVTMLAAPAEPVYALGRKTWRQLEGVVEILPVMDAGTCQVQLWRYDPAPLARHGRVDPFSLYLSLDKETDERVQAAREQLMEQLE